MSSRILVLIAVAALALDACGGGSSPAPTSPDPQVVGLNILAPEVDAAVVGTPLALRAQATITGSGTTDATDSVAWSSSDPKVATVDAHGVVSALAPGRVTVTATAKNVQATVGIDVVPNVAGDWSFRAVATNCDDPYNPYCIMGKPMKEYGRYTVTLTQAGHRITGIFSNPLYYLDGLNGGALEGRVNADGSLDLGAQQCELTDFSGARRYSLRDWHMGRASDGTYAGQLTWEYGFSPQWWRDCPGEPTQRTTAVLAVSDFRR